MLWSVPPPGTDARSEECVEMVEAAPPHTISQRSLMDA